MANIKATQTNSSDEWESPIWLVNLLNNEFRFTLDAAASQLNTKFRDFFTKEEDGLLQSWEGDTVWLNPPYSTAASWYEKAYSEAVKGNATTVMLVASRTDTRYWHNYAAKGEIRFLPGRLKFLGGKYSAPFPSAIVIFHRDILLRTPTTMYWNIRSPST